MARANDKQDPTLHLRCVSCVWTKQPWKQWCRQGNRRNCSSKQNPKCWFCFSVSSGKKQAILDACKRYIMRVVMTTMVMVIMMLLIYKKGHKVGVRKNLLKPATRNISQVWSLTVTQSFQGLRGRPIQLANSSNFHPAAGMPWQLVYMPHTHTHTHIYIYIYTRNIINYIGNKLHIRERESQQPNRPSDTEDSHVFALVIRQCYWTAKCRYGICLLSCPPHKPFPKANTKI